MKIFSLLFLLLVGCTQKYQTYHIIDKHNFDKDNPQTPITKKLKLSAKKEKTSFCAGQFFFSSNAKQKTDRYLQNMVRTMCSDSQYISNSKLTETWWTTLIYSRSCVELEGYCPRPD